jgi:hypothetical protein
MSAPISNDRIKSMIPRKPAMMNTATITTSVEPTTSRRLGHVTFFVSAWTSCRKVVTRATYSRMAHCSQMRVCRPKSHGHVEEAGQEGFEPPTPGFGVRCSSRSSYWPLSWPWNSTSYHSFHQGSNILSITAFHGESYAFDKSDNISYVPVDRGWCVCSSWWNNYAVDSCCMLT